MPALSWTARGRSRWWCSPAAAPCLLRGSGGDPGNRRNERKPKDFQCIKRRIFLFFRSKVYKWQFSPTYHVFLLLLLIEAWVSFPPQLRHLLLVTQLTFCWGLRPNRDECLNKEDFALAFPPFSFWRMTLDEKTIIINVSLSYTHFYQCWHLHFITDWWNLKMNTKCKVS